MGVPRRVRVGAPAVKTLQKLNASDAIPLPDERMASISYQPVDVELRGSGEGWASACNRQVTCGLMIVWIARLLQTKIGRDLPKIGSIPYPYTISTHDTAEAAAVAAVRALKKGVAPATQSGSRAPRGNERKRCGAAAIRLHLRSLFSAPSLNARRKLHFPLVERVVDEPAPQAAQYRVRYM